MSTRRARIKAVAALPPRRKNQDNADGKNRPKDSIEKVLKSPKSPRAPNNKSEENNSPSRSLRSPPALIPINKTLLPDKVPSSAELSSPTASETVSSPITEKVPVIIAAPSSKNVFVSPQARISSDGRRTASPLILLSPKSSNSTERPAKQVTTQVSDIQNSCDINSAEVDCTVLLTDSNAEKSIEITDQNPDTVIKEQEKNNSRSKPSKDHHNDVRNDNRIPRIPQSVTVGTDSDSIIPLQTVSHVSKPMSEAKNEISAYSEALFDPIVPLPSPSKVRPKLRPVPRLAPHRRNSIQGSASESEDESRRALLSTGASTQPPPRQRHDSQSSHTTVQSAPNREVNRIRNDSISSSVSQAQAQPPPALSPVKEKHFSNKTRRQEMSRRSWCRRREVKRDALTMYDLIFYNPSTNPIVPDADEIIAKEANAKEEAARNTKAQEKEEDADDPPSSDAAPVPQIKLGPNGEIILDEQSLVIKQSDANRKVSSVVREGCWAGSGGGRYTRAARTAEWSAAETVRFYRALGALGTDFTLMVQLFPGRKRKDLYLKFKKEERLNGAQVDKALRAATAWDVATLLEEFSHEREVAAKRADEERKTLVQRKEAERDRLRAIKEQRVRNSRGSKALDVVGFGADHQELTADDFIRRSMEARSNTKKGGKRKTGDDFVLPTQKKIRQSSTPQSQGFATLTLLNGSPPPLQNKPTNDLVTISRLDSNAQPVQISLNEVSGVPSNIETGSLVVLRVNDPSSPSKTMLQTYIAHGSGKLTPVSLPPTFLNSVVGYMKKGCTRNTASGVSSPGITSPSSVASNDSRSCTPTVIVNPSPGKRQRHSSYTITQL